jgi:hypothetical protein
MDFPPVPRQLLLTPDPAAIADVFHTVELGEVSTLDHEVPDHTVEDRALETISLLTGRQGAAIRQQLLATDRLWVV